MYLTRCSSEPVTWKVSNLNSSISSNLTYPDVYLYRIHRFMFADSSKGKDGFAFLQWPCDSERS
ncbi:hypothetical protein SLEP1_g39203 [Rubroshorea leprosula]|uniref:Uncharacterized protein n=1 Tax=Rubroshorea leprosula TaxID=152421 RepID=A0AAV5KZE8_9ROSI|nr:hypothetical protein SLEP1_g39203 [Rubroshorea leprosula]